MLAEQPPRRPDDIEAFLLEELPAMGPAPRGEEGLDRARRFFAAAGDPQDSVRQIHVVGTAGKGTAAAAIVGRLVGAGASVASHMSPHVYDLRERLLLNGHLPDWDRVADAISALWPAMQQIEASDGRPPSFFELTTAMAWQIGETAEVDYLVTEAGIGGEFDATNAIARADKISVIMPIGYDHLEILGDDLAEIARTKADVIMHGGDVVIAPQPWPEADAVVQATVDARSARAHRVADLGADWITQAAMVADQVTALLDDPRLDLAAPPVPVHLPGRLERLDAAGRTIVLDGAHNPLKLRTLADHMARPADIAVVALSVEKDLEACAIELARLAPTIITAQFAIIAAGRVIRQSWPTHELAEAIRKADPTRTVIESTDVETAMTDALERTGSGANIVATGSFMMLEPAREASRI